MADHHRIQERVNISMIIVAPLVSAAQPALAQASRAASIIFLRLRF
jgi:hypothetical protein